MLLQWRIGGGKALIIIGAIFSLLGAIFWDMGLIFKAIHMNPADINFTVNGVM